VERRLLGRAGGSLLFNCWPRGDIAEGPARPQGEGFQVGKSEAKAGPFSLLRLMG